LRSLFPRFRYFASRPEILAKANNNNSSRDAQTAVAVAASSAAASAAREAVVKHPEATAKFMAAGFKHLAANSSNTHGNNNRTSVSGSTARSGVEVSDLSFSFFFVVLLYVPIVFSPFE
jgi:hypothetical protein